nr:proteinase-activated receptor 4 [Nothobranchius furzeri]
MKLTVGTPLFVFILSSICSVSPSSHPGDVCSVTPVRLRTFRLITNCNITTLKEKQLKEIQAPTINVYLPVLYLLAFCVGLPVNILALWVLVFRTKHLPSTTLLINLTLVDCLLLMVLPFRIAYHFRGNNWELGEPLCRIVMAVFYGNMYGSVWCLAFVALDRYVAVVHPLRARTLRSQRMSLYMTGMVWVVILAAMLPLLLSQQTYRLNELNIMTCHDALPGGEQENYFLPYFSTLFASCFLLPFLIMLFCHSAVLHTLIAERTRYANAIRVTLLVLIVFIVCLLPSNVLLLLTYADSSLDVDGEDLYVPYMISLASSAFNSCIDPFIFYFVSPEFRKKVKSMLCCCDNHENQISSPRNMSSSSGQKSKVIVLPMSSRRGTPESENRLSPNCRYHRS